MTTPTAPLLRTATPTDFAAIWSLFEPIIVAGETYEFDESLTAAQAQAIWFNPQTQTVVAEWQGQIVGSYKLKPNFAGRGNHVANGSYIVGMQWQGQGIGRQLVEHSLQTAIAQGYRAMQFNIVVSTNVGAIKLYEKLGFAIVATIPQAFNHRTLGYVDTHVMYRNLIG
ncbi:MAG: GNAT family N-acetyltransferase [Spirulina sp. SIO3F2]|nr:GNAT family N-acetyltransferase [Spirulina sp. SIO3F2]